MKRSLQPAIPPGLVGWLGLALPEKTLDQRPEVFAVYMVSMQTPHLLMSWTGFLE